MMNPSENPRVNTPSHRDSHGGGGFLTAIRRFDIYTKLDEDYRVQTSGGATLSIIGWLIISILVFGELKTFMTPTLKDHLMVDTTLGQKLRVNLDITFHALTCADAHLDAMDVAGDNQLNIEHDMLKQRISRVGLAIGDPAVQIVGEVETTSFFLDSLNK